MSTLLGRVIAKRKLPRHKEILKSAKAGLKDLVTKPKETIRKGIQRDKLAVGLLGGRKEAIKRTYGVAKRVLSPTAKAAKKQIKPLTKEAVINVGGVVGGGLGGAVGGVPGALGGDLVGTMVVRKGFDDVNRFKRIASSVKKSPTFKRQTPFTKARILQRKSVKDALKINPQRSQDLSEDVIGWGIGNTVGSIRPGSGWAAAIPTTPITRAINRDYRRLRKAGESIRTSGKEALQKAKRRFRKTPNTLLEKGARKADRYLQSRIPNAVSRQAELLNLSTSSKSIQFSKRREIVFLS